MAKKQNPDFSYWIKQNTWTLEQATLIINGIEPPSGNITSLFNGDPKPPKKLQITYELLKKVPRNFHYQQEGLISPITAIYIAKENELLSWDIDESIFSAYSQYFKTTNIEDNEDNEEYEQFLGSRERRNFLKTIGILVKIFISEKNQSPRYLRGGKINASQVSTALIEKAQSLGIEIEGLKSLNRKITAALNMLDEEVSEETVS